MVWVQKNFSLAWRNSSNNQKNNINNALGVSKTELIKKIVRHTNSIKHISVVIRLSSVVVEDKVLLDNFAENVQILSNIGLKVIIVHDYNNLLTKYLDLLGISKERYSSALGGNNLSELLEAIISSYINKTVVSALCSCGLMAVGFSGKDGNFLVAKKSNHIMSSNNQLYVSEPLTINPEILFEIENTKIIPVISPVACNEKGKTMILDTDITSAVIARSISASKLVIMCENDFLINQVGVLSSVNELDSLLENNLGLARNDPLIKASRYVLLNSEALVQFVDSSIIDALLLSVFD